MKSVDSIESLDAFKDFTGKVENSEQWRVITIFPTQLWLPVIVPLEDLETILIFGDS